MEQSEKIAIELIRTQLHWDIIVNNPIENKGIPDLKCIDEKEIKFVEIKVEELELMTSQKQKILKLLKDGFKVYTLRLYDDYAKLNEINENLVENNIKVLKYPPNFVKKKILLNTCKYCNHVWEARVPFPKQCPRCKRYIKIETPKTIIKEIEGYKNE